MKTILKVQHIKCGGCVNSVRKALGSLQGVFGVEVDVAGSVVTVEHTDEVSRHEIAARIRSLGYPEQDTVHGFEALKSSARSYISCAAGRIIK